MAIDKLSTNVLVRSDAESIVIELMFRYALLMEHQLVDLQDSVRKFVEKMGDSLFKLDAMVTEEGKQAQAMYESLYEEAQKESHILNQRAAMRVDDIIAQTLAETGIESETLQATSDPEQHVIGEEFVGAQDSVWSAISKKLESVTRLEERLRPKVFEIVQCMNFEDIQSQRLEHLLKGSKLLNEGLAHYFKTGKTTDNDPQAYAQQFLQKIRDMYTMEEERKIFDNIFSSKHS